MRYFAYLILLLVTQVIAWVITPVLPIFAVRRDGPIDNANYRAVEPRLPLWLAWFDTPDNSLLGDNNWKAKYDLGYQQGYWSMVAWLYRNSLYGLKWSVLACDVTDPLLITPRGNPTVNRNNGITGLFRAKLGNGYWQWKLVKKIRGDSGIMWNFGWQLDEFVVSQKPGKALFQFSPRFCKIK